MELIFRLVYEILVFTSTTTGFTYKEINIIAYYLLFPFICTVLIDKIFKMHYLKISYAILVSITLFSIGNFKAFSDWLFDKSVYFLLYFGKSAEGYIVSSVIICVFIPIAILSPLIYFAFKNNKKQMDT